MSAENQAAQVAALVRELSQYEQRAASSVDEAQRTKWEARIEEVRAQLRARGMGAESPQRRASKRLAHTDAEQR